MVFPTLCVMQLAVPHAFRSGATATRLSGRAKRGPTCLQATSVTVARGRVAGGDAPGVALSISRITGGIRPRRGPLALDHARAGTEGFQGPCCDTVRLRALIPINRGGEKDLDTGAAWFHLRRRRIRVGFRPDVRAASHRALRRY